MNNYSATTQDQDLIANHPTNLRKNTSHNLSKDQKGNNVFLNNYPEVEEKNYLFEKLATEGHTNIIEYVEQLGLEKDPNIIILSPAHHYYYDAEDMKDVTAVLNLKQLNYIKDLRKFLHIVFRMLSCKTIFIGSFIESRSQFSFLPDFLTYSQLGTSDQLENGIASSNPFLNMIYHIIDSRTNRNMTGKEVTSLLEVSGLKVVDMTVIDGITYFCTKKFKIPS